VLDGLQHYARRPADANRLGLRRLVDQDRAQRSKRAHKVALGSQDDSDIFIRARALLAQGGRSAMVKPDAAHLPNQLALREAALSVGAAERPTRSMRAGVEGFDATATFDVEAACAHGARQYARRVRACPHRAFAMNEQSLAAYVLFGNVIVVTLDRRICNRVCLQQTCQNFVRRLRDDRTVCPSVLSRPRQVVEIRIGVERYTARPAISLYFSPGERKSWPKFRPGHQ